jgi:crotonobetainyl-CoA:carnitine CoA-transferase CaiB-like acyl-CoA transferase
MTRPLEGIRILDLSIALTGPYVATLMADQGADVIKSSGPVWVTSPAGSA